MKKSENKTYSNAVIFAATEEVAEGLKITAKLKEWGVANLNGYNFSPGSYDTFISDYYVANGYHLPLTVCHGHGFADIVGEVLTLDKRDDGLYCEAIIYSDYPQFSWVKRLVEAHVLGGVSDDGYLVNYDYDKKTDTYLVSEARIMNVSLVATPAEPSASVKIENTAFRGFTQKSKLKFFKKK